MWTLQSGYISKIFSFLLIIQLFFLGGMASAESRPLIFGIHPYLPQEELQQRFMPFVEYLSAQLDIPIKLQVAKNYEIHIENVGNQAVDFAYMGPASYVELTEKYGKHPLLTRLEINSKPFFRGYIVTANEQFVDNLALLKGKRFAFGSPHSTMSYLVPRHMLREAGVGLEALGSYKFMGNHRNVALGVLLGEFDAGAVKEEVYFKFREKGLRQVAISPSISEHVLIGKKGLADDTVKALREAMYELAQTDAGLQVLGKIKKKITGLVPVQDSDYDNLRIIMRQQ